MGISFMPLSIYIYIHLYMATCPRISLNKESFKIPVRVGGAYPWRIPKNKKVCEGCIPVDKRKSSKSM